MTREEYDEKRAKIQRFRVGLDEEEEKTKEEYLTSNGWACTEGWWRHPDWGVGTMFVRNALDYQRRLERGEKK